MSCKDFSYDKKVTRYGWVLLLPSQNLYINIYSTTESCFTAYFIYNLFVYAYSIIILQNTCFFTLLSFFTFFSYLSYQFRIHLIMKDKIPRIQLPWPAMHMSHMNFSHLKEEKGKEQGVGRIPNLTTTLHVAVRTNIKLKFWE